MNCVNMMNYSESCLLIEEYEKKLKAAGVHCELYLYKGALHGFCTMPGLTIFSIDVFLQVVFN